MATPPVLMVTLTTCGHCAEAKAVNGYDPVAYERLLSMN